MKRRQTQKGRIEAQFNSLILNALDFLESSIEEVEVNPKRTIIDFYTAVELFIKGGLMKEHWSLILSKPEQANYKNFLDGDFQSVTLANARERLRNIVGDDIGSDAFEVFREIGNHRNRLVHFHHSHNEKLKEFVVKDVLRGLYHLEVLLSKKWTSYFKAYKDELDNIVNKAYSLRDYLEAKFVVVTPEIENEKSQGAYFDTCLSCGFESSKKSSFVGGFCVSVCHVCEVKENCVRIPCPNCSNPVFVIGGAKICEHCQHTIDIDDVVAYFEPPAPQTKDELEDYQGQLSHIGHCNECSWLTGHDTVHLVDPESEMWICIACGKIYWHMIGCAKCGTQFPFVEGEPYCENCD